MPTTFASECTPLSEAQFAALVDEAKTDPARSALLTELLREDNSIYAQRGSAATIRMRGWILLAFEHLGLPDSALLFVLEELDNGQDAYLIAAAARALRSYSKPSAAFGPLLVRAISNIRDHDDTLSLETYGAYAVGETGTTATSEILESLRWLGADAAAVLSEIEAMHENRNGELSGHLLEEIGRTVESIRLAEKGPEGREHHCCCGEPAGLGSVRTWAPDVGNAGSIDSIVFEDQDGTKVGFGEFFRGQPSIVAFFYTRCNNPQKCSLTVTKLARVQQMLAEKALAGHVRTAAITYDPGFDVPVRLCGYGKSRGVRMDTHNKMLRATNGMSALCAHFRLGVNFIESLVNRHRVEVYILNAVGQIAVSFERLQWDERVVVDQAAMLIDK
jgi:protein SCO1/2